MDIRYTRDDPRLPETRHVDPASLAELRRVVLADRGVESTRIRWATRLVGDPSVLCPEGHPRNNGLRPAAIRKRWLLCQHCGGHEQLTCSMCDAVQLDPAPEPECGPVKSEQPLRVCYIVQLVPMYANACSRRPRP